MVETCLGGIQFFYGLRYPPSGCACGGGRAVNRRTDCDKVNVLVAYRKRCAFGQYGFIPCRLAKLLPPHP
jgi:hypothetical protein